MSRERMCTVDGEGTRREGKGNGGEETRKKMKIHTIRRRKSVRVAKSNLKGHLLLRAPSMLWRLDAARRRTEIMNLATPLLW